MRRLLLLLAALGVSGCTSLSYQPVATVGMSPKTLPLRVAVRDLQDTSPAGDRPRSWLGGTSATASDALAGELAPTVTDAIIACFVNDDVFAEMNRNPDAPDIVMSGTIRRFYGKARNNPYTFPAIVMTGSWLMYLGVPVDETFGSVDLELTVDTPEGERIASYSAKSEFWEWKTIYSMAEREIGTRLNQSFSEVISDLRGQMLVDREKLMRARRAEVLPP
jgi:hypothetical protein